MGMDPFDCGQAHHKDHRGNIRLVPKTRLRKQEWALPLLVMSVEEKL
jgi:hypothetical protein